MVCMFKYEVTADAMHILSEQCLDLLSGAENSSLEDLSFLRADGTPWFVSIKHEKDAFFKVHPQELDEVEEALGPGTLLIEGEDEVPEERY